MSRMFTTTGNAQSWRPTGYQDRCKIEGDIQPMAEDSRPLNYWIIGGGPLLAVLALFAGMAAHG